MTFTRAFLKSLKLDEDVVQAIIDAHTEVTTGLKDSLQTATAEVARLKPLEQELNTLKTATADYAQIKAAKEKAESDFATYKQTIEDEKSLTNLKNAYKALLKEKSIDETRFDAILRVTDFSKMKLDKEGTLEGKEQLESDIDTQWSAFKVSTRREGGRVDNPPGDDHNGLSADAKAIRERMAARHAKLYGGTAAGKEN